MSDAVHLAYRILFTVLAVCIGIGIFFALVRTIKGPRIADRIMGINMAGTLTIMAIAALSYVLDESYILDVCLIYCMISFLAVVVLCKIYITVHLSRSENKKKEKENGR